MADYTFYTNPMSRGQIARWALHEADADYAQQLVDLTQPHPALDALNPMGKVPTLVHHAPGGDRIITECAAICAYLAEENPGADLTPREDERADYLRWMFFAAGPVEQAITARAMGWDVPDDREGMAGFGSYQRTIAALAAFLDGRKWVCDARFTMADVYLGSQVDWGLTFGSIPPEPAFVAYAERCQAREGYKAAKAIDNALIAEMKK
ncbi:MAG: glutathione S-transferase family protein [Novosphingobium sp.]|nr:glutathione S-transferase family protein [Novosphingobium sp.]